MIGEDPFSGSLILHFISQLACAFSIGEDKVGDGRRGVLLEKAMIGGGHIPGIYHHAQILQRLFQNEVCRTADGRIQIRTQQDQHLLISGQLFDDQFRKGFFLLAEVCADGADLLAADLILQDCYPPG